MKIYNDREFPGILRYRDQFSPIPVPVLFSGTNFLRYRYRYFFPGPNFSGTGTGTFFRDQFFPVPVPVPPKRSKIPGTRNSRDRDVTLWQERYIFMQQLLITVTTWYGKEFVSQRYPRCGRASPDWKQPDRSKSASTYNQTINKTCYLSHQFSFSKSKKWEHGENVVLHM